MLIKNPQLSDFGIHPEIVTWEECERVLGKRRYKKFEKWMNGQTATAFGVYPEDLDRFLKGWRVVD